MASTAFNIAFRCLPAAASRAGGVLGVSLGQAALMMSAPLAAADCKASSLARCTSVGCTARSICSVGHAMTEASQSVLGVAALAAGAFAAAPLSVVGLMLLKRAFCSSLRES